jgi:hypothetical protein
MNVQFVFRLIYLYRCQGFDSYCFYYLNRGVGAMELVAMDMKLRGMYIARQLSFKGVSFKIEEIPIDKEFVKMYNEAVQLVY